MSEAAGPPAGFYEDGAGSRRWWDGSGWADRFEGGRVVTEEPGTMSDAEQRVVLDRVVAKYVQHGYSVQSNTGRQAVVTRRQRVQVGLNLALTVLTGGIWLLVLAIRLLNWPTDRVVLTIDRHGVLTPEFS